MRRWVGLKRRLVEKEAGGGAVWWRGTRSEAGCEEEKDEHLLRNTHIILFISPSRISHDTSSNMIISQSSSSHV
jgi:hypothetical protein